NPRCCPLHLSRMGWGLAGGVLLALLLACGGVRSKRTKQVDPLVGQKAPEVAGVDLTGKAVNLSEYRGKVVLLDIWATWCPHCIATLPHKRKLAERLKDKPFVLVSVNDDDEKETFVEFLKKEPLPWVNWWQGEGGVSVEGWEFDGYPSLLVLDHKGTIRYV